MRQEGWVAVGTVQYMHFGLAVTTDVDTDEDNGDHEIGLAKAVEDGDDACNQRREDRCGGKPIGRRRGSVWGIRLAKSEDVVSLIVVEPAEGQHENAEDMETAPEAGVEAEAVVRDGDEPDACIFIATVPVALSPARFRGSARKRQRCGLPRACRQS